MNKKQLTGAFIITAALLVIAYTSDPVVSKDTSIVLYKFQFEGYSYRPESNKITTIRHDIDGDSKVETLVGFQAYTDDEGGVPASFIMIGSEHDNKFKPMVILQGNDYFNKVELKDTDTDGLSEIVFWSGGGAHHTDLDIYKYANGKIAKVFSNGSSCPIEFSDNVKPIQIKIERENWNKPGWSYASGDNLLEAWEWSGKEFQFKPDASSVKQPITEEATQGYVDRYNLGKKQEEDLDKKESEFWEVLKATQGDHIEAELHQTMGYWLLESDNQWESATVHFKKAVNLEPTLYRSWYGLGLIYIDSEEGNEYFRKAIKANPDYSPPYYWLAYDYCRHKKDKEAISLFEKYVEIANGDTNEAGRLKVAIEALRELRSGEEGKELKTMRSSLYKE